MAELRLFKPAEALERFADEWRALAELRDNAFATPEWFGCWLRQYADEADVRVAVLAAPGGPISGLIPFAVARRGRPRLARFAGSNLADWVHPVAAIADEPRVAAAAVSELAASDLAWGALVFDNVDATADWHRQPLTDERGRTLRLRRRSETVLPYATLPDSYEEYLAGRSGSFRRQLRRFDRRLAEHAEIALRQVDDADRLAADLETFFRLHFGRWADRGGSSLDSDRVRAVHRDFAAVALERGWLRLLIMEADGEPIAAFYGWRVGGRYAFYQAGFNEDWGRFSVGLVLHGRVIERAIAEGAKEYDMLLGSEAYKYRFCDAEREAVTLVVTRPHSLSGLAVGADAAARSLVRRLPDDARERVRRTLGRLESRLPTGRRR
jgi:CelD/BcsL family acetyltransferase involved in cellulose biosynthesis